MPLRPDPRIALFTSTTSTPMAYLRIGQVSDNLIILHPTTEFCVCNRRLRPLGLDAWECDGGHQFQRMDKAIWVVGIRRATVQIEDA